MKTSHRGLLLVAGLFVASAATPVSAAPARAELRAKGGALSAGRVDQPRSGVLQLRNVGDAEGRIVSCEFAGPDASRFSVATGVAGAEGCEPGHRYEYADQEDVRVDVAAGAAGELSASLRVTYDFDVDDGEDVSDVASFPVSIVIMAKGPWVAISDPVDIGVVVNGDHEEFAIWIENSLSFPVAYDRGRVVGEVGDLKVKNGDADGCRQGQVVGPGNGCYLIIHDTGSTADAAGDHTRTEVFAIDTLAPYDISSLVRVRYVDRDLPGHRRPEVLEVQRPSVRGISIGSSVRIRVSSRAVAEDDQGVSALHLRLLGKGKQLVRVDVTPDRDGAGDIAGYVPVGRRIEAEAWAHDENGNASALKRSSAITFTAIDATTASARSRSGKWTTAKGVSKAIGHTTLTSAVGHTARLTYRVTGRYIALVARDHSWTAPGANGCVRVLVDGAELEGGCVHGSSTTRSEIVLEYTGPSRKHTVVIEARGRAVVDGLILGR